jgi:hypothetical protein
MACLRTEINGRREDGVKRRCKNQRFHFLSHPRNRREGVKKKFYREQILIQIAVKKCKVGVIAHQVEVRK